MGGKSGSLVRGGGGGGGGAPLPQATGIHAAAWQEALLPATPSLLPPVSVLTSPAVSLPNNLVICMSVYCLFVSTTSRLCGFTSPLLSLPHPVSLFPPGPLPLPLVTHCPSGAVTSPTLCLPQHDQPEAGNTPSSPPLDIKNMILARVSRW